MYDLIEIMDNSDKEALDCFFASLEEKNPVKKRYWELRSKVANRQFLLAAETVLRRIYEKKFG